MKVLIGAVTLIVRCYELFMILNPAKHWTNLQKFWWWRINGVMWVIHNSCLRWHTLKAVWITCCHHQHQRHSHNSFIHTRDLLFQCQQCRTMLFTSQRWNHNANQILICISPVKILMIPTLELRVCHVLDLILFIFWREFSREQVTSTNTMNHKKTVICSDLEWRNLLLRQRRRYGGYGICTMTGVWIETRDLISLGYGLTWIMFPHWISQISATDCAVSSQKFKRSMEKTF